MITMDMNPTALPDLASDYPLTRGHIDDFARDGHVLLRGLASPDEIAVYQPIIADVAMRLNTEHKPMAERSLIRMALLQISNLWEHDERVRRFCMARRFGKVAAELMGVDGVRMYHDQALYKEPGGTKTPWHQDQYYWPFNGTTKVLTMWMPLVDVPIERGALTFASGTHTLGYMGNYEGFSDTEEFYGGYVREHNPPISVSAMAAGDATFHAGMTLHHAPANTTDTMREVMTVIYVADGVRISEPENGSQASDLAWMSGQKPGDLVGSHRNPIIYKAE